jgi:DNA-binding transcriptional MerR regulator
MEVEIDQEVVDLANPEVPAVRFRNEDLKAALQANPQIGPPKRQKGKLTARVLERNEKIFQALELRKAGLQFNEIAEIMGEKYSQTVRDWVEKALKAHMEEPAEEVRQLEISRLDTMLEALWEKVLGGDPFAIDRCLKIMDRRAAYLGLDAPKQVDVSMRVQELAMILNLPLEEATKELALVVQSYKGATH